MKYSSVIALMNEGIQFISSRTLDIGDAYIVVKFKSALKKAFDDYCQEEMSMFNEAGIQDPQSFFQKHNELQNKADKDAVDESLLTENNAKIERFKSLQKIAQDKEADLKTAGRLSFESWRSLQEENTGVKTSRGVELLCTYEADLDGILWDIPSQDKKPKEPKA